MTRFFSISSAFFLSILLATSAYAAKPVKNPPAANTSPQVETLPNVVLLENQAYRYQVMATDADGDRLDYSLINQPAWLKINRKGVLSGTPSSSDIAIRIDVQVKISDRYTTVSSNAFSVAVNADVSILECTENDWQYSDSQCQSDGTLTRIWTTTGSCEGGVIHPDSEILSCTLPASDACLTGDNSCKESFALTNGGKISYYRNYSLNNIQSQITRAVIVVHGSSRNPWNYFDAAVSSAISVNKENDTIIIAPYFQATDDPALSDELQWSSSGWKIGNKSVDKAGLTRTSSFQVMDEMIASLSNQVKFPALVDIVVTGHSAGGQFTQRYAAGGKADLTDTMHRYKYVVANPGSYLYLDGYRAVPGDITQFSIPFAATVTNSTDPDYCPEYDDYKYGLLNSNSYMSSTDNNLLVTQYMDRNIVYFLGEQDVVIDDNLDTSCEAMLEGQHRYERGLTYMNYMQIHMNSYNHSLVTVPAVGHSKSGMYKSDQGASLLFLE